MNYPKTFLHRNQVCLSENCASLRSEAMRIKQRVPSFTLVPILLILCLFSTRCAQQESGFEIITDGQPAFKQDGTLYHLGITASEFEKTFGPPESRSKSNTLDGYTSNCESLRYTTDGLEVLVGPNGTLKAFIFYVVPQGKYKAANVRTDTGIKTGASARQIEKVCGKPYKRMDFNVAGVDRFFLYYKRDSLVLGFSFGQDKFEDIRICADYLPYLDKWKYNH